MVCVDLNFIPSHPGLKFQETTHQCICLLLPDGPRHLPGFPFFSLAPRNCSLQFSRKESHWIPLSARTLLGQFTTNCISGGITVNFQATCG